MKTKSNYKELLVFILNLSKLKVEEEKESELDFKNMYVQLYMQFITKIVVRKKKEWKILDHI
jgi:hypothetical protein